MISSLARYVRPAAAVAAVLLAAGAVQATPAFAAPTTEPRHAALSLTAHAVYAPDDPDPGPPGTSIDAPADAGPAPGTLHLRVEITNIGTDPLEYVNVFPPLTNGIHLDCVDDPGNYPAEPDTPFYPGEVIHCDETVSGLPEGTTYENVTTVTALGQFTHTSLSDAVHTWAKAGPPAPPSPPPPPLPPASVGHLVYLDMNRSGKRDEGESGIPGARLSIKAPDGLPPSDYVTGHGVVGPQTTDEHGVYHFRHLKPDVRYTVTLDMTSPALRDLTPTSYTNGAWEPDHATWELWTAESVDTYDSINFGFYPKDRAALSIDAPTTALAGTTINVKGHASIVGNPRQWADIPAVLEFRAGGTTTWTKVADASSSRGDRHVWVTPTRSGWFRWRSPGTVYITSVVSPETHVFVSTAPVALTATAPTTVRSGTPLTVTGTVTRSSKPFKTDRIVLQYSPDASTWTTVADVRSTDGTLTATVQPARTGSYRYYYAGDSRTAPGTSPACRLVVTPAPSRSSSLRQPR